jgi:SAM-dependent methyltransferase
MRLIDRNGGSIRFCFAFLVFGPSLGDPMEDAEYRKLAAVEDDMWYFNGLHALIERELGVASSVRPFSVLDAGCGTGGLIRRLAPDHSDWSWTGVDLSPLACALARERTRADIVEASVTALPFPAGHFDAVVSADVLYHLDDDAAALRESARVLRPGGLIVINVPAFPWLWSYHDIAVQGRRRYRRRELQEKLRVAGFEPLRATYWNTVLFPLIVVRRKILPAPRDGSDVQRYPALVEGLGRLALAGERAWLRSVGRLPWGSSVFAVGRKCG